MIRTTLCMKVIVLYYVRVSAVAYPGFNLGGEAAFQGLREYGICPQQEETRGLTSRKFFKKCLYLEVF